jgi:glycosyltransferase involved in cell wall biosynthesis
MAFYWPLFLLCRHLVYVCGNQRAYWRRRGLRAQRDSFIYNGIDTQFFVPAAFAASAPDVRAKYGFADNDYVIGICAALRTEKAHADLLAAVKRLRASGIPAKCLIIGDGTERARLENEIRRLGLASHSVITGFQPDVRPFMLACDAMALVSHAVETFSVSALESMAMGKPMVMTRIGGATEQIQEGVNGYTYPPGDISALCERLQLLADPVRREAMGAAARKTVEEHFSITTMVDGYERLFLDV